MSLPKRERHSNIGEAVAIMEAALEMAVLENLEYGEEEEEEMDFILFSDDWEPDNMYPYNDAHDYLTADDWKEFDAFYV